MGSGDAHLVEIRRVDPDDTAAVRAFVDVANAVSTADAPWMPARTVHGTAGALRYGWDLEPSTAYLASVDGETVAVGSHKTSERDNRHLALMSVDVHPAHRRQGHGTALADALTERIRDLGRTTILSQAWDGVPGGAEFARGRGFVQASVAVNRAQHLPDVDPTLVDRIHAESAAAAADYELVRMPAIAPEEERAALAEMVAAINDAPTDDLDLEDEVFDADRVHAYESAHRDRGIRLHRLVARHRSTGGLAGQTVVAVDDEMPWLGDQHDTSVVRAHRGHRLGAFLKTGMLLWLREDEPDVEWVHTWNAESNDLMIAVNEQLGYRVLGRELEFQKTL